MPLQPLDKIHESRRGDRMEWARILAYISGTVDRELLLRNEYLAAENRNRGKFPGAVLGF